MPRLTNKDRMLAAQHLINRTLTKYKHPETVSIVRAYNRKYVICLKDEDGQKNQISPRMAIRPIHIWLWAFTRA